MKKHIFVFLGLITLLLVGCREDYFYSKTYEIKDYAWSVDSLLEFRFEIKDTAKSYMWFIDVRHTAEFPFSNFYVFPKRISPNGKMYMDTLNIPLADPTGRWYGKGIGDILDNRVLWQKEMKFPQTGWYSFRFEQGSRDPNLEEIVNFGFSMYEY